MGAVFALPMGTIRIVLSLVCKDLMKILKTEDNTIYLYALDVNN